MYGWFLLSLMRLLGQISPSELRALNHSSPSSAAHSAHNVLILVTIGGSMAYGEIATYEDTIQKSKGKMIAYVVMTGVSKISSSFTFFFLAIRNICLQKSYSILTPILNSTINLGIDRYREEKLFKFFMTAFLVNFFCLQVLLVVEMYVDRDEEPTFWSLLDSFSLVFSNLYLLLFTTKLVFLTRFVRFNFLLANEFLKRNLVERQQNTYYKAPRDGLDALLNRQWKAHGFLDAINVTFGKEWAVIMSHLYVSILKYLYKASISSALFNYGDEDVYTLALDLFQASQGIIISIIVLRNGGLLTMEAMTKRALVWNAVPKVRNARARKKLQSFITQVSHLPCDLSAHGFFILNMKTFCNIITSIATQLVILLSMGNQ